jgi:hypothetical protein
MKRAKEPSASESSPSPSKRSKTLEVKLDQSPFSSSSSGIITPEADNIIQHLPLPRDHDDDIMGSFIAHDAGYYSEGAFISSIPDLDPSFAPQFGETCHRTRSAPVITDPNHNASIISEATGGFFHLPMEVQNADKVLVHLPASVHYSTSHILYYPNSDTEFNLVTQSCNGTKWTNLLGSQFKFHRSLVRDLILEKKDSWEVEIIHGKEIFISSKTDASAPVLCINLQQRGGPVLFPVKSIAIARAYLGFLSQRDAFNITLYDASMSSYIEINSVMIPRSLKVRKDTKNGVEVGVLDVDDVSLTILKCLWSGSNISELVMGQSKGQLLCVLGILLEAEDWQALRILCSFTDFKDRHITTLKNFKFPEKAKVCAEMVKELEWTLPDFDLEDQRVQDYLKNADKDQLVREIWNQMRKMKKMLKIQSTS